MPTQSNWAIIYLHTGGDFPESCISLFLFVRELSALFSCLLFQIIYQRLGVSQLWYTSLLRTSKQQNKPLDTNLLLTERAQGHSVEHWPEIMEARTELHEVLKRTIECKYFPVMLEQAGVVKISTASNLESASNSTICSPGPLCSDGYRHPQLTSVKKPPGRVIKYSGQPYPPFERPSTVILRHDDLR